VAIKAEIGSWRWEGVPFYLRTGKRLEQKQTEIIVNFKPVPHSIFDSADGESLPNQLIIQLQPEEKIRMRVNVKAWGDDITLKPVHLNLDFNDVFQKRRMIAYERLLPGLGSIPFNKRGSSSTMRRKGTPLAAWGHTLQPV